MSAGRPEFGRFRGPQAGASRITCLGNRPPGLRAPGPLYPPAIFRGFPEFLAFPEFRRISIAFAMSDLALRVGLLAWGFQAPVRRIRGGAISSHPGPPSGAGSFSSSGLWGQAPAPQYFGESRNPQNSRNSPRFQGFRDPGSCAPGRIAGSGISGAGGSDLGTCD